VSEWLMEGTGVVKGDAVDFLYAANPGDSSQLSNRQQASNGH
jgi:hypothetical protein